MNVSAPFGLTGSAPLTVQINGAPGARVELILQGEGCSIRKSILLDATGKGTAVFPTSGNCPGAGVIIHAKDDVGRESRASSFRI